MYFISRLLWKPVGFHKFMSTAHNSYDVVIVGGGMVGMSMACALASEPTMNNKKVLLLEARPEKKQQTKETYSNRVSAISPASRDLFTKSDVWKRIQRWSSVRRIQAWDGCTDAAISFGGNIDISYIVENDVLLHAMKERLLELDDVDVKYDCKVTEYSLPKTGQGIVELKTNDRQQITTKLLIGADGFNSRIRSCMGVQTLSWKYDQRSIVATCHLQDCTNNNAALQKFTPKGPIALLPLADNLSSLVWSTTASEAKHLLSLTEEEFTECLNSALWQEYNINTWSRGIMEQLHRLYSPSPRQLPPNVISIDPGSRASFPLGMTHSTSYISKRVALIGDAAHRVHPLAGLGANLGFGDVNDLTQIIRNGILEGREIGSMLNLQEYETSRLRKNLTIMAGIEGIFWSTFTDFEPVCLARSLGFLLSDAVPQAKEFFTSVAVS